VSPTTVRKEKSAQFSSKLPASILAKSSRPLRIPSRLSAADLTVPRHCRLLLSIARKTLGTKLRELGLRVAHSVEADEDDLR
jgi:hypothetical protein